MPGRADALPQRLALVEGAQIADIAKVGVGQIKQAIARAGGEHQMPVIEKRAGGEQ